MQFGDHWFWHVCTLHGCLTPVVRGCIQSKYDSGSNWRRKKLMAVIVAVDFHTVHKCGKQSLSQVIILCCLQFEPPHIFTAGPLH